MITLPALLEGHVAILFLTVLLLQLRLTYILWLISYLQHLFKYTSHHLEGAGYLFIFPPPHSGNMFLKVFQLCSGTVLIIHTKLIETQQCTHIKLLLLHVVLAPFCANWLCPLVSNDLEHSVMCIYILYILIIIILIIIIWDSIRENFL